MSLESSENPRQFNRVESQRFIEMIEPSVQEELFAAQSEDRNVVEVVVDTYRESPPEDEQHADIKADAALDMLSNRLLMSPRKRLQIVRGHAHRLIEAQLRQAGDEHPDMSTVVNQAKIDSLALSLSPHMLLGQIARHYSRLHARERNRNPEHYPDDPLEEVVRNSHNQIIDIMDSGEITKKNAIGLLIIFGLREFSSNSFIKLEEKLEVVSSKNLLGQKLLRRKQPLAPQFKILQKVSELDARGDKTVKETLNLIYKEYMNKEKMDVSEARRRFLIDSHKAMAELFEITD